MNQLAVIKSRALLGLQAPVVTVEAHLANGLPSFTLVGLPETEVKESRDRVRAALQHCRFDFPAKRITLNLAPADLPKESGRFDLPIALAILAASGQLDAARLDRFEFAGELSLSGELRPIRGALAMALAAKRSGKALVLPEESALEAALVKDCEVYSAKHLLDVVAHFVKPPSHSSHESTAEGAEPESAETLQRVQPQTPVSAPQYADFQEVKGQAIPKRALEIAAAGGHSVLLVGPPGTGKSMLAQRFAGLLPPMTDEQAMESAAILSLAGKFDVSNYRTRPFRHPHSSASAVALVGGGGNPKPGEVSLAHCGTLFLDELPEFDRGVLESLREPLESGIITISRAARQVDFPARFQLIAAMNPCPCGYLGHKTKPCRCTPDQVLRYQGKISGPLLDRIDLQVEVGSLTHDELLKPIATIDEASESSAIIAQRTTQAFALQHARQACTNAQLEGAALEEHCPLDEPSRSFLAKAMTSLNLSARATHRVIKIARTIADLAHSKAIHSAHLAEAIQYRRALKIQ